MAYIHTWTTTLKRFFSENILKVPAFLYVHGVPLGIASGVYSICNINGNHLVPYVMGGHYSTCVTNTDTLHLTHYYNFREGRMFWINGYNHSQFEIVYACEIERNIDCRTKVKVKIHLSAHKHYNSRCNDYAMRKALEQWTSKRERNNKLLIRIFLFSITEPWPIPFLHITYYFTESKWLHSMPVTWKS